MEREWERDSLWFLEPEILVADEEDFIIYYPIVSVENKISSWLLHVGLRSIYSNPPEQPVYQSVGNG